MKGNQEPVCRWVWRSGEQGTHCGQLLEKEGTAGSETTELVAGRL